MGSTEKTWKSSHSPRDSMRFATLDSIPVLETSTARTSVWFVDSWLISLFSRLVDSSPWEAWTPASSSLSESILSFPGLPETCSTGDHGTTCREAFPPSSFIQTDICPDVPS